MVDFKSAMDRRNKMGAKPTLTVEQQEANNKAADAANSKELAVKQRFTDAVAQGFTFQTMLKLEESDAVQGIYRGMTDEKYKDPTDPDAKEKDVKVVFVETQPGVTVRMLGNSQVVQELERGAKDGDQIFIVRQPGQRNTRRGRRVHLFAVGIKPA